MKHSIPEKKTQNLNADLKRDVFPSKQEGTREETGQSFHKLGEIGLDKPKKKMVRLPIQPKLKVGKAGDKYEREADAVAEQVARMASSPERYNDFSKNETKPLGSQISKVPAGYGGMEVSGDLEKKIKSAELVGKPLTQPALNYMEKVLGKDFSDVKIHTGNQSEEINEELGARAFTINNNIYFNTDEYNPDYFKGNRLLVHELSHVLQNNGNFDLIQKQSKRKRSDLDSDLDVIYSRDVSRKIKSKKRRSGVKFSFEVKVGAQGEVAIFLETAIKHALSLNIGLEAILAGLKSSISWETKTGVKYTLKAVGALTGGVKVEFECELYDAIVAESISEGMSHRYWDSDSGQLVRSEISAVPQERLVPMSVIRLKGPSGIWEDFYDNENPRHLKTGWQTKEDGKIEKVYEKTTEGDLMLKCFIKEIQNMLSLGSTFKAIWGTRNSSDG
jgi:hypothetical protein